MDIKDCFNNIKKPYRPQTFEWSCILTPQCCCSLSHYFHATVCHFGYQNNQHAKLVCKISWLTWARTHAKEGNGLNFRWESNLVWVRGVYTHDKMFSVLISKVLPLWTREMSAGPRQTGWAVYQACELNKMNSLCVCVCCSTLHSIVFLCYPGEKVTHVCHLLSEQASLRVCRGWIWRILRGECYLSSSVMSPPK